MMWGTAGSTSVMSAEILKHTETFDQIVLMFFGFLIHQNTTPHPTVIT
jgi:hypothetical protein